MKTVAARPYRQKARAEAAEQTRLAILQAAVSLWREQEWDEVTLSSIAARAGVTVQTVLRRFGSKEGVVDACLGERVTDVGELRDRARTGDVRSALDVLLEHYERDGEAVLRTLNVEGRSAAARRIAEHGRAEHRAWCERVFSPYLPSPRAKRRRARLDAFVAATDIYLWKLLRHDLGRTQQETRDAVAALLTSLTAPQARGKSG